jgi:superfamily I DNA/RNA helicase
MKTIIGPPGTGKTTRLLSIIDELISRGYQPHDIAFLTFSRKAASEAKTRSVANRGFGPKELKFYRTIHSLAYGELGIRKEMIIQRSDYAELGEQLGLHVKGFNTIEDGLISGMAPGDKLFFLENLSRITKNTLARTFELFADDTDSYDEFLYVAERYRKFKQDKGIMDFTDLLERYLKMRRLPSFKCLIVDEAQDLSKLQWEIINKLATNMDVSYAAGDDDQAIYKWAGADVGSFIRHAQGGEVLMQSYRLPRAIHDFGGEICSRISERTKKEFLPRDEDGSVEWINGLDNIDMSEGTWLLLGRNDYIVRAQKEFLELQFGNKVPRRIVVSTIHGAKGAEADNVVLSLDMSRKSYEGMLLDEDSELRVWYVGVTRAKKNLYILEPQGKYYFNV